MEFVKSRAHARLFPSKGVTELQRMESQVVALLPAEDPRIADDLNLAGHGHDAAEQVPAMGDQILARKDQVAVREGLPFQLAEVSGEGEDLVIAFEGAAHVAA